MGVHWICEAKTSIRLYDLRKLYKHSAADEKLKALYRMAVWSTTTITGTTPQTSVDLMINLISMDLMIQKVGISAYSRLKSQLNTPWAAIKVKPIPYMQYWERFIKEYNIKMPIIDI